MLKINLLYVITKLELGGAQKQLLSIVKGLDKERYNVFLFTAKEGLLINEASSINNLTLYRSRFLERAINPFKDFLALVEIRCFIKKNKIQIVHTHSSKAGILGRLAAKLAQTPTIIHTVHGWSFNDYQPKVLNYIYRNLEKFCANFTNKIVVVSESDKVKGLTSGIKTLEQYQVIKYGIELGQFTGADKRLEARKVLKISNSDLVVGMIACFKSQKAPLDFIKLASAIKKRDPNIKFVLVGDGRLRSKICDLIKKLGLEKQVILTGWRNDVPAVLTALDVFVLTSLWEGLPIVVLEAMAAGVPVVATNTGGIVEIIKNDENGYLVGAGNLYSMQTRVEVLLKDSVLREKFAKKSKLIIESGDFLLSSMVKNTEKLYSDLLRDKLNA